MDDVLILIDQQKAMEHAKWGPRNNADAERNIARLLAAWRARKMPIIHVKHDSTSPVSPFRPGQEGNDFKPLTAPLPGETVVVKTVHSAFIGTDLRERLEAMGRPALVICGVLLAN
jgi:nicotinamidase-related amidase